MDNALSDTPYCRWALSLPEDHPDRLYHELRYGFPVESDNELFGRLLLEINQAGLSWSTILRKEAAIRRAYDNFRIERIAAYGEEERLRLLGDAGIIRNRLKIDAAIANARKILDLCAQFGSFKAWLDHNHPLSPAEWTQLFQAHFRFTGGEIVKEFLMSTGYLPGAHGKSCPVFEIVVRTNPPWCTSR